VKIQKMYHKNAKKPPHVKVLVILGSFSGFFQVFVDFWRFLDGFLEKNKTLNFRLRCKNKYLFVNQIINWSHFLNALIECFFSNKPPPHP